MSAPRHLWSGDWKRESAAAAEAFANRTRPADAPSEPLPAEPPSALARALGAVRRATAPGVRRAFLVGLAALLSAGAAYAAVTALLTSDTRGSQAAQQSSTVLGAPAWLGVDTTSFPLTGGAMILEVVPGSPADAAGLQPGDVITEIDNRLVKTPEDLESALAGLHAGQRAQIGYEQGPTPYAAPSTYTTSVTLKARPSGP